MAAHPERLLRHVRELVPGSSASTEAELLDRFVRWRDEDAFAALVARHGTMVLGVCRRVLRDADLAEDVAQATFLALARSAGTIRRADTLAAWLHRTACHLALKQRRAETRRRRREVRAHLLAPAPAPDPLDEVTVRELLAIFDEEVQRLPERYRLPLILCCLEGCTLEEAARRLEWTPGSVKGRLERARLRLHVRLVRRGLTLPAALVGLEAVRGVVPAAGFITATLQAVAESGIRSTTMSWTKVLFPLLLAVGVVAAGALSTPRAEKQTGPQKKAADQPAKKQQARTDRHGDPLPDGALARLGTIRWRAAGEIEALALAPDGNCLATASRDGLCLLDQGGRLMKHIRPPHTSFERLAFAPDGKRLACWCMVPAGRDRGKWVVQIRERPTGRMAREYDAEHLQWLGWSPGGELLAVILVKGAVLFRDLAAGKERRLETKDLPEPHYRLASCACAPAAKLLAVPDQRAVIHVWDLTTGKKRCTIEPKGRFVPGLALSPDGKTLASLTRLAGDRQAVQLWDMATGKPTHTVAADQKYLNTLAFAPDGKTLATVGWLDVRFHDPATGRERSRTKGPMSIGPSVSFTADGKTLATTERYSGAIHLWDVSTGALKPAPAGHTNRPGRIDFSPDGRRVATTGSMDGTIFVWAPATGEALARFRRSGWVRACAFSADGRSLYSCLTGETVEFCDAATGRVLHTVKMTDPDRPDTRESGLDMRLSGDKKTLVAFSHSYTKGRAGAEEGLLLTGWDVATRKELFRRRRAQVAMWPVVSADARVLAATPRGDRREKDFPRRAPVRLEDLATGKHLLDLPQVEGHTYPLGFSPDGRLLATTTSRYGVRGGGGREASYTVRLWELETAREVLAVPTSGNPRVAFSADGRLLALPTPAEEVQVWDLRRGQEAQRFKGAGPEVTSLAFSPDGRRLVSGLSDSTLLVWGVAERQVGKAARLDGGAAARAWADLEGEARKAFGARGALAGSPAQAVALLKGRLKPVQPADPGDVQRLLADLDSDSFATREKARKELEEMGDRASGALHAALRKKPSLEVHRRIQALLRRLRRPATEPQTLRACRAVAVLEDIGTPEARKVLQTLAKGAAEARLTQEAKAALARLSRPAVRPP
jgi:RNA polymerase sigma factor (sigma-70 family)